LQESSRARRDDETELDRSGGAEFNAFRRKVGRLIDEGLKRQFALIEGNQINDSWDTQRDAERAGKERFGQVTFTVYEVQWFLPPYWSNWLFYLTPLE
jgi:hypothetical protein